MDDKKHDIQNISVDLIDDPVAPIRSDLNDDNLSDLASSIKSVGIIEPLIVRSQGKRYEVIAGHRRLAASRLAGLAALPVIVRNLTEKDGDILKVHENLYREDVAVVDEAEFINSAMHRLKIKVEEFAQLINRSSSYVRERLKILNYDNYMVEALQKKQISFSVARYLSRIENPDRRREYTSYAVSNGITPRLAEMWYRTSKEGNLPEQPVGEIVGDPSGSETTKVQLHPCTACKQDFPLEDLRLIYICKTCKEVIENN